jgi:cytidine deaminase
LCQNSTEKLVQTAIAAKQHAVAPYSNFHVGAAIQTTDGTIYSGCNIESSSYSLTICAERVALFKALSEGEKQLDIMAVIADGSDFCPPCGACRQLLMDFAPNLLILLVKNNGEIKKVQLRDLLPYAFSGKFLTP